jgi:hypothetical protein
MIHISDSDASSLCRYLRTASAIIVNSHSTRDIDRARLMSKMHDKLAVKIIRSQCEKMLPLINEING